MPGRQRRSSISNAQTVKKIGRKVLFFGENYRFFSEVDDKFHPVARVYLPRVSDVLPNMEIYLPIKGPPATLGARLTEARHIFC